MKSSKGVLLLFCLSMCFRWCLKSCTHSILAVPSCPSYLYMTWLPALQLMIISRSVFSFSFHQPACMQPQATPSLKDSHHRTHEYVLTVLYVCVVVAFVNKPLTCVCVCVSRPVAIAMFSKGNVIPLFFDWFALIFSTHDSNLLPDTCVYVHCDWSNVRALLCLITDIRKGIESIRDTRLVRFMPVIVCLACSAIAFPSSFCNTRPGIDHCIVVGVASNDGARRRTVWGKWKSVTRKA